jgi:hypothetical protein
MRDYHDDASDVVRQVTFKVRHVHEAHTLELVPSEKRTLC